MSFLDKINKYKLKLLSLKGGVSGREIKDQRSDVGNLKKIPKNVDAASKNGIVSKKSKGEE